MGVGRDFVARYEAGECSAWDELVAMADVVAADRDLRAEAAAVASAVMARVRRNADRVRAVLASAGAVLADEEPAASARDLERVTRLVGPLPIALEALWRVAGGVSLLPAGDDPYAYGAVELERDGLALIRLDPLSIDGAGECLREQLDEYEQQLVASGGRSAAPLALSIAPDFLHKANVSGGSPYTIMLPPAEPADAVDPPVVFERHNVRLVAYLRLCFRWGGFPGLDVVDVPRDDVGLNLRGGFWHAKVPWRVAADRVLALLCRDIEPF